MKTVLLFLILVCSATYTFGQARTRPLPKPHNASDTTLYWYKWVRKWEQKTDLTPVEKLPHLFHFRCSTTEGNILDVWQQDSSFQGCLTKWAKDADDELRPYERIYYQRYELSPKQARAVGRLIKNSGILQLPSQESIKGWEPGLDGTELLIQYSEGADYYFKDYWSAYALPQLPEAVLVNQFEHRLYELINNQVVQQAFRAGIPFPSFTTDNAFVTVRPTTTEQYWQHKHEVRRYVRQSQQAEKK